MPKLARCCLILLPALATGAEAQSLPASLVARDGPGLAVAARPTNLPDFRISEGDLREAGRPPRSGLIAAVPLGRRLHLGIGRFAVPELARPRSHTEPQHRSADIRRRERGIAAMGVSFQF